MNFPIYPCDKRGVHGSSSYPAECAVCRYLWDVMYRRLYLFILFPAAWSWSYHTPGWIVHILIFFSQLFFQMTWKRPHSVRFHHAWGGHSPWQTPQRCGFSHLEGVFELGGKKGESASHVCSARPAAVFIMSLLEGTEMNDIGVFFSRELWHSPLKENNALFSSQSTQSEQWKKKNLIAIHLNESTANQVINLNKDASVWHHYCKYAIALSCSDVSTPPILWHLDTFYGVFGREEEEKRGR